MHLRKYQGTIFISLLRFCIRDKATYCLFCIKPVKFFRLLISKSYQCKFDLYIGMWSFEQAEGRDTSHIHPPEHGNIYLTLKKKNPYGCLFYAVSVSWNAGGVLSAISSDLGRRNWTGSRVSNTLNYLSKSGYTEIRKCKDIVTLWGKFGASYLRVTPRCDITRVFRHIN